MEKTIEFVENYKNKPGRIASLHNCKRLKLISGLYIHYQNTNTVIKISIDLFEMEKK